MRMTMRMRCPCLPHWFPSLETQAVSLLWACTTNAAHTFEERRGVRPSPELKVVPPNSISQISSATFQTISLKKIQTSLVTAMQEHSNSFLCKDLKTTAKCMGGPLKKKKEEEGEKRGWKLVQQSEEGTIRGRQQQAGWLFRLSWPSLPGRIGTTA